MGEFGLEASFRMLVPICWLDCARARARKSFIYFVLKTHPYLCVDLYGFLYMSFYILCFDEVFTHIQ